MNANAIPPRIEIVNSGRGRLPYGGQRMVANVHFFTGESGR